MAKIGLITKTFSREVEALAESLASLGHDVTVVTDKKAKVPQRYKRTVLTAFENWSALEAFKFISRFFTQAPHIWHFVFTDPEKESPTSAHFILATFAKALPRRSVITTFWNAWPQKAFLFSRFAQVNDLMTFGTRESLMRARRKGWIPDTCAAEVMPPLPVWFTDSNQADQQELQNLCENLKPFLYVPHQDLPTDVVGAANSSGIQLLARGSRPENAPDSSLFYLPVSVSEADVELCLQESCGILTAFHQFSPAELIRFQHLSQKMEKPILAHSTQNEILPGFCLHNRSGFLIESDRDLKKLFQSKEWTHFRYQAVDPGLRHLQDSVLNDLNRLYTKLLSQP